MAYAGSNTYSKKVGAPPPWGAGTNKQYAPTAGSAGCKGEPSSTGGLGRGSITKLGNAKKK